MSEEIKVLAQSEKAFDEMSYDDMEAVEKVEASLVEEEPKFKTFDKGDFRMKCSCGHEEVIAKSVSGGIQFIVPTTDSHSLDMQCPKCLHSFKFYFTESEADVEEVTEIVEENNDEQVLQEDTKSESL